MPEAASAHPHKDRGQAVPGSEHPKLKRQGVQYLQLTEAPLNLPR